MDDDLQQLRTHVARFRRDPYLVTVTADGSPHCGTVTFGWDDDGERPVVAAPSSWPGSAAGGHTRVTLLWSPDDDPRGYSLIVDGTAEQSTDSPELTISLTRAVLHRRGEPTAANTSRCASDCVPILKR